MASSSSIPCGWCQERFKSPAELRKHNATRPTFCSKNSYCAPENGCYMCLGSGEHQRKETGAPLSNHQCEFCNVEFTSPAALHGHNKQRPVFCKTRNYCTTQYGCSLCGGECVHCRKDNQEQWTFEAFDVWS